MTKCKTVPKDYALFLLFAILAAPPALADYTPPGGGGFGHLQLGGTPAYDVSIEAPADISGWVLSPGGDGMSTQVGTLQVGADGDWQVSVSDSSSTTNGHMTEWDGSSYISSKKLAEPLSVSVADGAAGGIVDTGNDVSLSTTASILAIGSQTGWPNTAQIPVSFKQPVSLNDKVLAGGHSYKIVVTFTISGYP